MCVLWIPWGRLFLRPCIFWFNHRNLSSVSVVKRDSLYLLSLLFYWDLTDIKHCTVHPWTMWGLRALIAPHTHTHSQKSACNFTVGPSHLWVWICIHCSVFLGSVSMDLVVYIYWKNFKTCTVQIYAVQGLSVLGVQHDDLIHV